MLCNQNEFLFCNEKYSLRRKLRMKIKHCMTCISNFYEKDPMDLDIKSGQTRHGTGVVE